MMSESDREQLPSEYSTFICPQYGGEMWMPNDPEEPFCCMDCAFETFEMPDRRPSATTMSGGSGS